MNHPLQKLDMAARSAVMTEAEHPQLTTDAHTNAHRAALKTVGGFAVYDSEAEEFAQAQSLNGRRELAKTYIADVNKLKAKLEGLGVEALGFAPGKAWEYICRESGLYRLRSQDGYIKTKAPFSANSESWLVFPAWFVTTAMMFVVAYYAVNAFSSIASFMQADWGGGTTPAVIATIVCMVIALVIAILDSSNGGHIPYALISFCERSIFRLRMLFTSHAGKLRALMPEGHTTDFDTFRVSVVLPDPPEDVRKTLLRLESLSVAIEVVAEPAAIGFVPSLESQALKQMRVDHSKRMEEARRRAAMRIDPIITVREGLAVALVAQFGDFPIEEEVMHRGLAADYLL